MARTPTARIDPALLVWARESFGLSVENAAKKVKQSADRLRRWEAGEEDLSIAQLRALGKVYKRPLAVFFLPEPPKEFLALRDFRRLAATGRRPWSPDLHLAVRRALEQQEYARELRDLLGDDMPVPDLDFHFPGDDPDDFAQAARERYGIPLAEQRSWRQGNSSLNGWIRVLEEQGFLILQASRIDPREMRGFTLPDRDIPVIVLNGADAARGRVFTLIHELAHILLDAEGVCDLSEARRFRAEEERIEVFCNQVAASFLMPRNEVPP